MRGGLAFGIAGAAALVLAGIHYWGLARSAIYVRDNVARLVKVPLPEGVSGGAIHVAAHDPIRATCWGDGSVTIRRGESMSRIPPLADGARFRRVAVPADGVVFALTTWGGLYDLSRSPPRKLAVKGIQSGANIAAGGESDDLWIGGESGALIRVRRPSESVEADDQGDPSITALAVGPGSDPVVTVYRADGSVTDVPERRGGQAMPRTPLGKAVALVRLRGIGTYSRGADQEIGVVGVFESREVALYFPEMATPGETWVRQLELDADPKAACAIDMESSLLVATDAGERIVSFHR